MVQVICESCGKTFQTWPRQIRRAKHLSCSNPCRLVLLHNQTREKLIERNKQGKGKKIHPELVAKRRRLYGPENPAWRGGRIARKKKPYIYVRCPAEYREMARKDGYVLEHRLIMAQRLDRPLLRSEVVHHKHGNENSHENLRLYQSNGEHLALTLVKTSPESPWKH